MQNALKLNEKIKRHSPQTPSPTYLSLGRAGRHNTARHVDRLLQLLLSVTANKSTNSAAAAAAWHDSRSGVPGVSQHRTTGRRGGAAVQTAPDADANGRCQRGSRRFECGHQRRLVLVLQRLRLRRVR